VNDVLKNNSMFMDLTYLAIALCNVKENTPDQSMQYAFDL
jgi:hypothetical protein